MTPPLVLAHAVAPPRAGETGPTEDGTPEHDTPRVIILAADDRVRARWRREIEQGGQARVLGETAAVNEAVQLVRAHRPSVIAIDLSIPGWHPATVVRAIRNWAPVAAVILAVRPPHNMGHTSASADELHQAGATVLGSPQDRLDTLLSSLPRRAT